LSNSKTTRRKASRLTIDTDHFVLADVDGENLGKLPMRIEMLPFRISVAVL
jgi:diacylglycerol kinase (ATP)